MAISGSRTPPIDFTGGSTFSTSTRSNRGISRFAITLIEQMLQLPLDRLMTRFSDEQEMLLQRKAGSQMHGAECRHRC